MKPRAPLVVRAEARPLRPTRRPGLQERLLLSRAESADQNLVLIEAEAGAEVEDHPIQTSESIVVLTGRFEVHFDDVRETLAPGDLVHFPAHTSHGLRCLESGRLLVIWAPPLAD